MYDFNCLSNRLLQADIDDYNGVLAKFLRFIEETEIIHNYIECCGICTQDIEQEYESVCSGDTIFDLGETDEEETRNVYAILKYAVEKNISIHYGVAFVYSNSNKFQDRLNAFNARVTKVLILHIENYLTKLGIDMGVDDKVVYNITSNGQVNIANNNAVINATNNNYSIDLEKIEQVIKTLREEGVKGNLSKEDNETLSNSLEIINDEIKVEKPRKAYLSMALTGLKAIKGTAEFGAALTTLYHFIQPFIM